MSEATSQVEDQSRTQRDRIVETLRTFGDDLDKMATQSDGGMAADLAREGASRARELSSQLDGREPRDLLDDVRSFARRKPGTFLLGALAAGVVAGRLTRGAKDGTARRQRRLTHGGAAHRARRPRHRRRHPAGRNRCARRPTPVYPTGADRPADPATTGLPNPAGSVAGETTWADTRASWRSRMSTADGYGPTPRTQPGETRSIGEIVGDISKDMSTLIKQEMDLAKSELKQEVSKIGKGAGMFGGAGLAGHFALFFLSFALTYLLDNWMPVELAALIVGALWGVAAAVLAITRPQGDQGSKPATPHHPADSQGGRPMGQNTEELTTTPADIEATRSSLTRDIDELTDKVSPSRVIDRRKEAAKGRFGSLRDKVMGSATTRREQAERHRIQRDRLDLRRCHRGPQRPRDTRPGKPARGWSGGIRSRDADLGPDSCQREGDPGRAEADPGRQGTGSATDRRGEVGGPGHGSRPQGVRRGLGPAGQATAQDSVETVKQEGQSSAQTVKDEATPH